MRHGITFIILLLMWLLLTWSTDPQQIGTGLVVALGLTLLVGKLYHKVSKLFNPVRWFWFIVYVFFFMYHCFRANLDVAYRALHPDLPIHPGIIKVPTQLTSDLSKTFLANSITLTPGTLTVDIKDNYLFIHWINVVTDDPEQQANIVIKPFENILKRIFE